MTFARLLAEVIGLLDRAQVPYMITGSVASSYHGEPRATRDLDIGGDADKIDFIVRRDRRFSVEEFGRRRRADLLRTPAFIASAEDTIISKLEWAATTGSDRQLRDVAGMVAVGGEAVDMDYVERWVRALGLEATWRSVIEPDARAPA